MESKMGSFSITPAQAPRHLAPESIRPCSGLRHRHFRVVNLRHHFCDASINLTTVKLIPSRLQICDYLGLESHLGDCGAILKIVLDQLTKQTANNTIKNATKTYVSIIAFINDS